MYSVSHQNCCLWNLFHTRCKNVNCFLIDLCSIWITKIHTALRLSKGTFRSLHRKIQAFWVFVSKPFPGVPLVRKWYPKSKESTKRPIKLTQKLVQNCLLPRYCTKCEALFVLRKNAKFQFPLIPTPKLTSQLWKRRSLWSFWIQALCRKVAGTFSKVGPNFACLWSKLGGNGKICQNQASNCDSFRHSKTTFGTKCILTGMFAMHLKWNYCILRFKCPIAINKWSQCALWAWREQQTFWSITHF